MVSALKYFRNGFVIFGLFAAILSAANVFFEWGHYSLLQSYVTTVPFLIAFNFHVLFIFVRYWDKRFQCVEKRLLNKKQIIE